jgi:tetratricopeptide (TPR) repeat protein
VKRLALPLLLVLASPLRAQIPDRFENLRVFPRDIPRDSLVQAMRSISLSLGVRCVYCHVGQEGANNFEGYDFDSDDKRPKRTARFMMRMVRELNTRTLAQLPDRRDPPVQVTCMTCHRGMPFPTTIEAVLTRTIDSAGVAAAITRYRQLRQENLERGRFDFSEGPVADVARRLAAQGKSADAEALLVMNGELHPESAAIDLQMGDLYRARGDREHAAERYRRALEKQPNNAMARRRLEELAGAAPP